MEIIILDDIILDDIEKLFPNLLAFNGTVLIFANYRTGSTALGMLISGVKHMINFTEILDKHDQQLQQAEQLIENNGRFCASIMPGEYVVFRDSFLNHIQSYKIHLTRKNKIDQISSLYVSSQLAKFQCFKNEQIPSYSLTVDGDIIKAQIGIIKNLDSIAENTKINYNVTVDFEDIRPLLSHTDIKEFVKPSNFEEIQLAVEKQYK